VRPPGGTFTEIYSSNQYKGCGEFVVRGDDLYLFVERVAGGTAVLKYTEIDDTTPPSVPANVQAEALTTTSIKVTWSASTDNVGVAGYQVYRNGIQTSSLDSTIYVDTKLLLNTTYSYTVSAYDAAGNYSAQSSPQAVATTLGFGKTGQEGITGGVGLNNIGLLARIWGKFTYVDSVTFLLDDGSGQPAKCTAPPGVTLDPAWDFVTATGIVSCRIEGQDVVGILKLRNQADIEVLQ
jgi:hypothetical protein